MLGGGGGKALIAGLSSSEAHFRHFFGIEYDSDLAALARKNLRKISAGRTSVDSSPQMRETSMSFWRVMRT